ncbi:ClpXP protease specificity-enhancing factor [Paucibacter sp. TC2R-5]|uniref:ClpXP protease specificity-enhancing factor n=1 Tax=Paucibacter sp. TC2R-5 TaxID=2893555 RepID=UPI0021E3B9BD|nr:ClpXP protease specificity-enhancing factor [Paucibacter sp. TC2R-5]MCV2360268.1 ClpXP protease specificity-enhancing factor [Paucibacter sp. TC2R-5]
MEQSSENGGSGSASTRPYLIRALHDWCTDNGFTPYIAVHVDRFVQVPMEYVSNNEIVLNVGFDATSSLELGNEFIQFKARFGGTAREIIVPIDHVVAIYARENGQGMAFPAPDVQTALGPVASSAAPSVSSSSASAESIEQSGPAAGRPAATPLRSVKLTPSSESNSVETKQEQGEASVAAVQDGDEPDAPPPSSGRPSLKRIK